MGSKKTSDKSPEVEPGTLVPQPHGGAILRGNPGNAGGTGRPPSVIREKLRGSFEERVRVLEEIADGIPYHRIDVPLASLLRYACCPTCGGKLEAEVEHGDLMVITIEAKASASVNDRIKSIDLLAKYGLGTKQEVSGEDGAPIPHEVTVRFVRPEPEEE